MTNWTPEDYTGTQLANAAHRFCRARLVLERAQAEINSLRAMNTPAAIHGLETLLAHLDDTLSDARHFEMAIKDRLDEIDDVQYGQGLMR